MLGQYDGKRLSPQFLHIPSRVEEGRGGGRLPVAMAGAFAAAPQSGLPWPRFPFPLIEPDVRFPASGIARRKVKSIFPVSPLLPLVAMNRERQDKLAKDRR